MAGGQIADKYEKSRIIRLIKLLEIGIMAAAAVALWHGWYEALLILLFLMGAQSAFFGPVKYAILPQVLRNEELVGGNALVLLGAVRRPIRFVMDSRIFASPVLSVVFRLVRAIPIAPRGKDPAVYEAAFEAVSRELRAGQLVCIFPEGKLTTDGEIDSFRAGIETIIQRDPVPVVPMALQGLWGSFFSHKDGPALSCPPRRFWSRIGLVAGTPWPAEKVTAAGLEAEVRRLRGDAR